MSYHYSDLWLIEPNAMREMRALAARDLTPRLSEEVRESRTPSRQKSVAILPIHGALEARSSFIGDLFGFTSMEAIGRTFDLFVADESVSGIVLDVASPGGMVYGAPELAHKIFSARGTKPIIAVANPIAASGAYWIASAADRVIASQSADVGSVGVITSRLDITAQLEQEGVKEHVMRSQGSPYKGEHVEVEPMTVEAQQNTQHRLDMIYDQFAGDLAKFRGVSVQHVREHFGKGRLVDAKSALAAGMIDRIDTFESTWLKLDSGRIRIGREAAQDDWNSPTQQEALRMRVQSRHAQLAALAAAN